MSYKRGNKMIDLIKEIQAVDLDPQELFAEAMKEAAEDDRD